MNIAVPWKPRRKRKTSSATETALSGWPETWPSRTVRRPACRRAGLEETQAVDFKDEVGQVQVELLEFAKEQGENESSVPTTEGLADQVPQEIIE